MTVEKLLSTSEYISLDYGDVWSEDELVALFNIELPDLSGDTKSIIRNAKAFELKKVQAYCMINEQLLKQGKCFIQEGSVYRIPLINEIQGIITKYYNSSTRKFNRAERLRKSFSELNPVVSKGINDKASRVYSIRSTESRMYAPMNGA